MTIREPNWDFTLRNQSHLGKNGMLGTRWMIRTARECVESYQKVQLPSREPPRETAHSAQQGSGTRRKGLLRQTELCDSCSRTANFINNKVIRKRLYRGQVSLRRKEVEDHRRRPQAKTSAISVSYKCPQQIRPPWLAMMASAVPPGDWFQDLLHHNSCF